MENKREIKFRVWDKKYNVIRSHDWLYAARVSYDATFDPKRNDLIVMQFTGLHDKNGVEIYSNDLIRIRGKMGNDMEYSFDAIYQVSLSTYKGLSIRFIKLTNQEPDSRSNSYPIIQNAGFEDSKLCVDYRNNKYDCLAFADHYYDDSSRRRHQDHHYTNDIEIIGSTYTHPHLLEPKKEEKQ